MEEINLIMSKLSFSRAIDYCKYVYYSTLLLMLISLFIQPNNAASNLKRNQEEEEAAKNLKPKNFTQITTTTNIDIKPNSNYSLFDLMLKDDDSSSSKYNDNKNFKDNLSRHSYNIGNSTTTSTIDFNVTTQQQQQVSSLSSSSSDKRRIEFDHHQDSDDLLSSSDSRLFPIRLTVRSDDEEFDTATEEDTTSNLNNIDFSVDGASSNLNEQKVVKEITKILSKGMSSATDQVRLDTLENLRKKQKERKVAKDNRAKLFEDLLTAAISSHPEKVKRPTKGKSPSPTSSSSKRKKVNNGSDGGNLKTLTPSPLTGLINNPEVDPDIAVDAETVVQHLQGLASIIEDTNNNPPASYNYNTNNNNGGQSTDSGSGDNESSNGSSSSATNDNESTNEDEENSLTKKKNKTTSTEKRPILKQFNKIKRRISMRKKQLDQVKKMFNVDLAINPKDGSLMGKPTTGKLQDFGDFTVIDGDSTSNSQQHSSSSGKKTRTSSSSKSNNSKMRELMAYLRENPEILASVMSELTTDSDPTRSSSSSSPLHSSSSAHSFDATKDSIDTSGDLYQDDFNDKGEFPTHSSAYPSRHLLANNHNRKSNWNTFDNIRHNHHSNPLSHHYDLHLNSASQWPDRATRATRSSGNSRLLDLNQPLEHLDYGSGGGSGGSGGRSRKLKMTEQMLLESLRERQLMNLARLELVLADRQHSQASNRSHTYSSPNSTSTVSNLNNIDPNHQRADLAPEHLDSQHSQSQQQQRQTTINNNQQLNNNKNTNNNNNSTSDDEVTHHYVMMNTNGTNNDQLQHQVNRYLSESNSKGGFSKQQQQSNNQQSSNTRQQQQPSLGRFKDWRDVSRAEASSASQRNDKTYSGASASSSMINQNNNLYDSMTAGVGSSNSLQQQSSDSYKISSSMFPSESIEKTTNQLLAIGKSQQQQQQQNSMIQPVDFYSGGSNSRLPPLVHNNNNNNNLNNLYNESPPSSFVAPIGGEYAPAVFNQQPAMRNFGDSIITRPGSSATGAAFVDSSPYQQMSNGFLGSSIFMTRSSASQDKPASQASSSNQVLPPAAAGGEHHHHHQQKHSGNGNSDMSTIKLNQQVESSSSSTPAMPRQQPRHHPFYEPPPSASALSDRHHDDENLNSEEVSRSKSFDKSPDLFELEHHHQQQQQFSSGISNHRPVDYFSAYKSEISTNSNNHELEVVEGSVMKKSPPSDEMLNASFATTTEQHHRRQAALSSSTDEPATDSDDGLGAMWAR